MHSKTVALLFLKFFGLLNAALIANLPNAPTVQFKQYTGYLDASDSHHIFYWFTESQNNPSKDPVIVWLSGGPGCSGLSALLTENGPFTVLKDGSKLVINENSWNNVANVLWLESPVGVGFSYTNDSSLGTNDELSAKDNWAALRAFFTEFPQFKENDFYVAGESYGGIYVPMLATEIVKNQDVFKINLKGVAIGNGCVSEKLNTNTMLLYGYSHGMIDEKTWKDVNKRCCNGRIDDCKFYEFSGWSYCANFVEETIQNLWYSGINPYDIYSDCYNSDSAEAAKTPRIKIDTMWFTKKLPFNTYRKNTLCLNEGGEMRYLNNLEVRKALHVPKNMARWYDCSDDVGYNYVTTQPEMESFVRNLANNQIRVLIYNGDTDVVCNFIQGQRFAASLGFQQTSSKKAYYVNDQVSGYHTQFGNVEFVTIRGAGHMVPTDKPEVALHLIRSFLKAQRP